MRRARVNTAALLFGFGLGGLLYGIALRGLLRWQQVLPGDGGFDFVLFLVSAVGVVFLFSAFRAPGRMPSGRAFAGCLLLGWGLFSLAYGIVVHLMLDLHHVHELPGYAEVYDWAFLAVGALLVLVGLSLRDLRDPEALRDRRSGIDRRLVSMLDQ
jgi:uncharacterized membrane protein